MNPNLSAALRMSAAAVSARTALCVQLGDPAGLATAIRCNDVVVASVVAEYLTDLATECGIRLRRKIEPIAVDREVTK
jgi:hypothetical protein